MLPKLWKPSLGPHRPVCLCGLCFYLPLLNFPSLSLLARPQPTVYFLRGSNGLASLSNLGMGCHMSRGGLFLYIFFASPHCNLSSVLLIPCRGLGFLSGTVPSCPASLDGWWLLSFLSRWPLMSSQSFNVWRSPQHVAAPLLLRVCIHVSSFSFAYS